MHPRSQKQGEVQDEEEDDDEEEEEEEVSSECFGGIVTYQHNSTWHVIVMVFITRIYGGCESGGVDSSSYLPLLCISVDATAVTLLIFRMMRKELMVTAQMFPQWLVKMRV